MNNVFGGWKCPNKFRIKTKQDAQVFLRDLINPESCFRIRDLNDPTMCWIIRRDKDWTEAQILHCPINAEIGNWAEEMKHQAGIRLQRDVAFAARKSSNCCFFGGSKDHRAMILW